MTKSGGFLPQTNHYPLTMNFGSALLLNCAPNSKDYEEVVPQVDYAAAVTSAMQERRPDRGFADGDIIVDLLDT
jgi:hypothetical protein